MSRIIIIFLCFFITLSLAVGVYLPKIRMLESLGTEIDIKEAEIEYHKEKVSLLNELSQKISQYQSEVQKINSALPAEPSLASLLNFLQLKAAENGLFLKKISSFSVSPFKEKKEIKEIGFSLEVFGFYPSFKNFLSALERSARILEVEKISFTSPAEKNTPYSSEIIVKTYSY